MRGSACLRACRRRPRGPAVSVSWSGPTQPRSFAMQRVGSTLIVMRDLPYLLFSLAVALVVGAGMLWVQIPPAMPLQQALQQGFSVDELRAAATAGIVGFGICAIVLALVTSLAGLREIADRAGRRLTEGLDPAPFLGTPLEGLVETLSPLGIGFA